MAFQLNRHAARGADYPSGLASILSAAGREEAEAVLGGFADHAETPLVELPGLAARLGIARLAVKDEGARFGLGAFKAVGGAYAVYRHLARTLGEDAARRRLDEGGDPAARDAPAVCCASAGNHGLGVAFGARRLGCGCVVFVHAGVTQARIARIEALGARVVQTAFGYDATVRHAGEVAAAEGWTVISDTACPGYVDIPSDVMHGYMAVAAEAERQFGETPPSHVFLQCGVGGFAAAACAQHWIRYGTTRPTTVAVESDQADSLRLSLAAGERGASGKGAASIMLGLAADELSITAWEILRAGAHGAITVSDAAARDAMRRLAEPEPGDPAIVAGEAGAAGLAGLTEALADDGARAALELGADSRVLVYVTEAAQDPDSYRDIVGRTPEAVRSRRIEGASA
ncbi:diaminopropionate ammonia-lyase [Marinicauda salina]|uniref:Diaminopropionate ammonia-lyase n=1 Tax=Marinicauda salina TaxID=2135793 RepID=A0A2U2BUZ5_9PROT|nr:diaminopropionate ammonia-lyase [Marinicauda salina]PWE17784.1 diaminopropionate ammonia-lyase [Marinicauda salina]